MKVAIYRDEAYSTYVQEVTDPDDDFPSYYLPVEIPDDLWTAYLSTQEAFHAVLRRIVSEFGHSDTDPDYFDKHNTAVAKLRAKPIPPLPAFLSDSTANALADFVNLDAEVRGLASDEGDELERLWAEYESEES